MGFDAVRVPDASTRIYKDECVLTFLTSESEDGLFVCMKTFLGFSKLALDSYFAKTMNDVFLRIKTTKVKKPKDEGDNPPQKKPTKMAIGMEGGFELDADTYEYSHEYAVVVLPDMKEYSLESSDLPENVKASAAAIIAFDSATFKDDTAAWEEKREVSKYAEDLQQLDNGIKVPPGGYKCEKCDLTDNLWLNLTDGSILCGRRFFDGSGGNNHAVDHYKETGYPLAVKLGTITPDGADVFSYAEDDMVIDPHLDKHLAHFGINILEQKKTTKTMAELEIEANQQLQFEFDAIQESGVKLEPVYGPGHTGMRNLGNSCYMNTVLQVLFSLPEMCDAYASSAIDRFLSKSCEDPVHDLDIQLHKVGYGLVSGDYSAKPESPEEGEEAKGITPRMFKDVANSGHPEFSTGRQQDAMEYWAYLLDQLSRVARREKTLDPSALFGFDMEELVRCNSSNKVRLSTHGEGHLAVPVNMDLMTNREEYSAYTDLVQRGDAKEDTPVVRPSFELTALIEAMFQPTVVEDWYSPAIKAKTSCTTTSGFKSFPKYLVCAVNKFYLGDDWTPKKRDITLHVPDELDLTHLVSKGKKEGDEDLPEDGPENQPQQVQLDEGMVSQLASMGFPLEGCKKAVFHNPQSIEAAMEWVMSHMGDPDFAEPFVPPGSEQTTGGGAETFPEESVSMLMGMGFSREQAVFALKQTSGNLERAADWIFSHMSELDALMAKDAEQSTEGAGQQQSFQGSGRYRLKAFISHMGSSAQTGHYVCHILKEGRWVIFNDRKVALSQKPPRDLAYMYLFESV